jgi:hypothetical protein
MLTKSTQKFNFNIFRAMDILNKISIKIAGKEDLISIALSNAIWHDRPAQDIINTIKEMAKDNRNMMADILGLRLLLTIINFE